MPIDVLTDVLMIGAHPDDVEWAIGGIALKLRDEGARCAVVDLTAGEMGSRGTVAQRERESAEASEMLRLVGRENLGLPDCGLVDSAENRRLVAAAIRRHRPRVVLAPLWHDRHPDHAAAGQIVQNCRLLCGLKTLNDAGEPWRPEAFLFYPIHDQHPPTFIVDTAAVYERKLELMRLYRSQFVEAEGDFLFRLESRDRYTGSLIGTRHGEALVADRQIAVRSANSILRLFGE